MTTNRFITVGRRALVLVWVALLVGLVGLAAWTRLAPTLGHELFIVRGGSMEPTIPLGSLIVVEPAAPERIAVRDVVTVVATNGVLVTHRVIRVADSGNGPYLGLKGDASVAPDPVLVPATAVTGVVRFHVPLLGYLTAMFMTPPGILAVGAALGALLLMIMLLEDSATHGPRKARQTASTELRDRGVAT